MRNKRASAIRVLLSIVILLGLITSFGGGMYSSILLMDRKIDSLVGENADKENENLSIQGQMETLAGELEAAQKTNSDLEADKESLSQNIADLEAQIAQLEKAKGEVESQLEKGPKVSFYSPTYIRNGLEIKAEGKNPVAVIDNRAYVAADMIGGLVDWPTKYHADENTLTLGDDDLTVTRLDLLETDVLYGGDSYSVYLPKDGTSFSMGGKEYTKGILVSPGYRGVGYLLLNTESLYSSISFLVGRQDEARAQDVNLKIYLNDELEQTVQLSASVPSTVIDLNINYASSVKIEIETTYESTTYCFTDMILHR